MFLDITILAISSGLMTHLIQKKTNKGSIFSSAVVILLFCLCFEIIKLEQKAVYSAIVASASYMAMVSDKYIKNALEIIITSTILSIIFVISLDIFVGVGGKLGTIAGISCLTFIGLKQAFKIIENIKNKKRLT